MNFKLELTLSTSELEAMKNSFHNWLCQFLDCSKHKRKVAFGWSVGQPQLKKKRIAMPLEVTMTNEEKITVRLSPKTQAGKPTKLDGAPKWSIVSGPARVVPADDGL